MSDRERTLRAIHRFPTGASRAQLREVLRMTEATLNRHLADLLASGAIETCRVSIGPVRLVTGYRIASERPSPVTTRANIPDLATAVAMTLPDGPDLKEIARVAPGKELAE
jgi:predicted ArsR family transcriptional regulator